MWLVYLSRNSKQICDSLFDFDSYDWKLKDPKVGLCYTTWIKNSKEAQQDEEYLICQHHDINNLIVMEGNRKKPVEQDETIKNNIQPRVSWKR